MPFKESTYGKVTRKHNDLWAVMDAMDESQTTIYAIQDAMHKLVYEIGKEPVPHRTWDRLIRLYRMISPSAAQELEAGAIMERDGMYLMETLGHLGGEG